MTKVDGEFEIVGDFKLPIDAFKLNLNLPSQRLEGHVLTESAQACSTSHSPNEGCRVYRLNTWLNWSKDHFLKSNLNNALVPIQINFDINSDRMKTVNWEESNFNNLDYEKFLQKIRTTNIEKTFYYTNNYLVKHFIDNTFTPEQQLDLVSEWTIYKNLPTHYQHHKLILNSTNFLNQQGTPIKQLLKIWTPDKVNFSVTNFRSHFETFFLDNPAVQKHTLDYDHHDVQYDWNQKYTISYQQGTFMKGNQLIFAQNTPVQGFFVPQKSQGVINSEIGIKLNQATFLINWTNSFSFQKNYLFSPEDAIEYQLISINHQDVQNFQQFQLSEFTSWK